MRAWFVNEKFTEDSDPVSDMEIGIGHYLEQIKKDILERESKQNYYFNRLTGKRLAELTSNLNIARFVSQYYEKYGVEISLAVINYLVNEKKIDKSRVTLIHTALQHGRSLKRRRQFIRGMVEAGVKIKSLDINFSMYTKDDEMTRFLVESAIQQRKPKLVKRLLDSALKHAIKRKKVDMILWLFEKGADPAYNKYETLRWALENDHKELVKVVLKHINNDPEYQ